MPSPNASSVAFTRRRLLGSLSAGVASAAAAGLAGCSALAADREPVPIPDATPGPDDWPATGYDAANTRYNADTMLPRSAPSPRWTRDFRFCHEPVVRGSRVVANAEDRTVGIRATDGEVVWRSESTPWGFERPTLGAERAYATGEDCVYGVDLDGGAEDWHGQPCHGANTQSGTVAGGRLYLEYGGYFSALDATGRVTWAARSDAQGSPAVVDDRAYLATAFTVEAVDLTATAREWPWEDRDDDEPAHASRESAIAWSVPPEPRSTGPRFYRSPAVSGETTYATAERGDRPGGELRALDLESGEERWTVASPPSRRPGEERPDAPDPVGEPVTPVVADDLVVTALGDRRLQAFRHDGTAAWTTELGREVTDLAGAGDALLAITHDRSVETTGAGHAALVALDLASGSRLWELGFEDHLDGLAVAAGTIYATVVTEREADGGVVGQRLLALG